MSKIQPGSNDYFSANQNEIARIKKISTSSKGWFVKKACKVMRYLRKKIYGNAELTSDYKQRLSETRKLIQENSYKKNIEDYVDFVVNDSKQKVFESFKSGMPELNAVLAKSGNFVADRMNYPELNRVLNKLNGKVRAQVCEGLEELPGVLEGINTDDATPFLQFVQELKDVEEKTKPYLAENLAPMKQAMIWKWKESTLNEVPNPELVEMLKLVMEWQGKLKGQQDVLLEALPSNVADGQQLNSGQLKYYGFLNDQIDAVKKISQAQMKDVSGREKLEESLIGFLTGKVTNDIATAERIIAEAKAFNHTKVFIKNSENEIAKIKKELRDMRWHNEEDYPSYKDKKANLKTLKEDMAIQKELQFTLKNEWKKTSHAIKAELNKDRDAVKLLKGDRRARITQLIELSHTTHSLTENAETMKKIYKVQVEWDILLHVANTLPRQGGEYSKIESKIKLMQVDLAALPEKNQDPLIKESLVKFLEEIQAAQKI